MSGAHQSVGPVYDTDVVPREPAGRRPLDDRLLGYLDEPTAEKLPRGLVVFHGWTVDPIGPVAAVMVAIDGRTCGTAQLRLKRPDVAAQHPNLPGALNSGWRSYVDLRDIRPNRVEISVFVLRCDGSWTIQTTREFALLDPLGLSLPAGYLDQPVPERMRRDSWLVIRGWVLLGTTPVRRVLLSVDGIESGAARLGIPRPDVAELSSETDAPVCGFEHFIDLSNLPRDRGTLEIGAAAQGLDGSVFKLSTIRIPLPEPALQPEKSFERAKVLRERIAVPAPLKPEQNGRIRLLAFTHSLERSGPSNWLLLLIRALREDPSFSCVVVSADDGPLAPAFEALGVPVHISAGAAWINPDSYEGKVHELAAWAHHHLFNAALICTQIPFLGADLSERLGIPTVWAIHEVLDIRLYWETYYGPPGPHTYVRGRALEALRNASVLTFPSKAARRVLEPYADPSRMLIIPNAIDLDRVSEYQRGFDRKKARRKLGIPVDATAILSTGWMHPLKGPALLAQAFGSLAHAYPEALLVLVGADEDTYSNAVRDYVRRAGLEGRTKIVPKVADTYEWYGTSDLFVCASDMEAAPLTVREAMAFKLPVVSTRVGDIPGLLEDGLTGYLCEPRELGDLVRALARALHASPDERRTMGNAGASVLREQLDIRAAARAYLRLFLALVTERTAPLDDFLGSVP